jgi:hypothetical protein
MPAFFADSSALVKLCLVERGSGWLRSLDLEAPVVSALVYARACVRVVASGSGTEQ